VDGLGSTRALTDINGLLTDAYAYEAFGEIIKQLGNTQNSYLFAGEQRDPNLSLDYLRARYLDVNSGRFTNRDVFEGTQNSPITFNKYLYTNSNPINGRDPSGYMTLSEINIVIGQLGSLSRSTVNFVTVVNRAYNFMDIIHAIKTIGIFAEGVISGEGSKEIYESPGIPEIKDPQKASLVLMQNIPRIMSRAFKEWVRYLALVSKTDVEGFILYLPTPHKLPSFPQIQIKTPLKIGTRYLKLIAGGSKHKGRLIGAGLCIRKDPPGDHQVWRMDYDGWHRTPPFANSKEISVWHWRDDDYHFHVLRPPR
jgi:RHS repeat-associated protein